MHSMIDGFTTVKEINCHRTEVIVSVVHSGELKTVQLSGLHVPASYLAAVIQTAARKNQWPLDKVTFYTEVTPWLNAGESSSFIASLERRLAPIQMRSMNRCKACASWRVCISKVPVGIE